MSIGFSPRICFLGGTHASHTLMEAARRKGFCLTDEEDADVVFVSMDTPTLESGERNLEPVRALLKDVLSRPQKQVVLTSQVPPGFTRSFKDCRLFHQAETLRIEDAIQRAMYPEMLIVGRDLPLPVSSYYREYLEAWDCPIIECSYEEAEFSKMAINYWLAKEVETATFLSGLSEKVNADWRVVSRILRHDRRIGKYAYTTPGDWKKSSHLLRDFVTLNAL